MFFPTYSATFGYGPLRSFCNGPHS